MAYPFDVRPLFRDRADAGRELGERLAWYRGSPTVVLAIPRGGVPVAVEMARVLEAELDVVVARKLGAPGHAELAIGAITADGDYLLNQDVLRQLRVSDAYLAQVMRDEQREARRREQAFRGGRPPAEVEGRTVFLVDDGLATGATMAAAARSVRKRSPARLIAAVPVGSEQACVAIRAEVDEVVCLAKPEPFYAVGVYYQNFAQLDDADVMRLLEQPRQSR